VQVKFAEVGIMYTYGTGKEAHLKSILQTNGIWLDTELLFVVSEAKKCRRLTAAQIGFMICADMGIGSNSLDFTGPFWSTAQNAEFLVRPVSSERKHADERRFYTEGKVRLMVSMTALSAVAVLRYVRKIQLDKLSQLFHHTGLFHFMSIKCIQRRH